MSAFTAYVLLLLAALFWGVGNVAQKSILEDLGPLTTIGLRCLVGAVIVAPLLWREGHAVVPALRASWRQILIASALFTAAVGSQQFAFGATSVTNGSFLITTTTVMTPAVAWLLLRERPGLILLPAIALTLLGVFLLGGGLSALAAGDLCALASALIYSVWIVYLGRLVAETGLPAAITLAQFALAGLLALALGLMREKFEPARVGAALPELVVLGIFATGLAYVFQALAQQRTSASIAAVIMSAECVFGAIGGYLVLGERLSLAGAIGAGLILVAVLLVQIVPAAARAPAPMSARAPLRSSPVHPVRIAAVPASVPAQRI